MSADVRLCVITGRKGETSFLSAGGGGGGGAGGGGRFFFRTNISSLSVKIKVVVSGSPLTI